jgi:hypothetical protein
LNFDSQNCTLGCRFNETPKHIFFNCDWYYKVWCRVFSRSRMSSALHNNVPDHAHQIIWLQIHFLKFKGSFQVINLVFNNMDIVESSR